MGEEFDAYRDALVVEKATIWPEEFVNVGAEERRRVEERLHADPRNVQELVYVRLHAGFCRQITVTAEDLQRVRNQG